MNKPHRNAEVVPYSKLRRVLAMMYPSVQRKPMIHGLFEVDVTNARTLLKEHKSSTGEALSFTAFILNCLAHALDADISLQAYRQGRRHLVLFDDMDVAIPVERTLDGTAQPIIAIIRAANKKSLDQIHCEIRHAQSEPIANVWEGYAASFWLSLLPMSLIQIGWWVFCWLRRTYPEVQKEYGGTVGISNIGMFGHGSGWGIPLNDHTLDLTLGSIASKPGVVNGQLAIREYLSMTVSVNHAIVDGAPAARFTQRLKELIESGYGLDSSA